MKSLPLITPKLTMVRSYVFDMRDGDFPDSSEVETEGIAGCESGFEDYVGTPAEDSELLVDFLTPTEASWDAGDQSTICSAYASDGSTTNESIKASGR